MIRSSALALALALGLSPLLALAPGAAHAQPKLLLQPVPTGGYLDWSRSWSADWGVGQLGLPAPDVLCTSGTSSLTCTGATPSVIGAPTYEAAVGYPTRYASVLNGLSDYYELGVLGSAGSKTVCVAAVLDSIAAHALVASKWGVSSGGQTWQVWYQAGVGMRWTPTASNNKTLGSPTVGVPFYTCAVYKQIGAGNSVYFGNFNGTAVSPSSDGALQGESTNPIRIGAAGDVGTPSRFWPGKVLSVAIWHNWDATEAQAADMVAAQMGTLVTRPRDGNVTVTSAASLCNPAGTATGTLYQIPANSLCCHSTGCDVFPAVMHGNRAARSSDLTLTWNQRAGPPITVTYSATGGPANGPYSSLVGVGAQTVADIWINTSGFTAGGPAATGFYLRKSSATGTIKVDNPAGGGLTGLWYVDLSLVGSGWEWITSTHPAVTVSEAFAATAGGASGVWFASNTADLLNFDVSLVTQQDSAVLGAPTYTVGVAVAGTADVATEPNGVPNYASMWYGIKATLDGSPTSSRGLLTVGTYGGNNSLPMYISAAGFVTCAARDATTATRLVAIAAPAAGSGPHTYICGYDGEPRLFLDGVAATAYSGSVATITAVPIPATVQVGAALYTLGGKVYRVCQGDSYATVAACLQ